MNPLLWAKIGLVGALLAGVFMFGHRTGANAVQGRWDADKAQRIEAQDKLIAAHAQEVEQLQAKQALINVKVGTEHDAALQAIGNKYKADLAAVRAAGGLRIPATVCRGVATAAEATSDGQHHGDTTSTVILPDSIASDLFSLARDADAVVEQSRSCQNWIRQNGFYGPVHTPDAVPAAIQ